MKESYYVYSTELTYSIENIRNLMEVVGFSIVENTELDKKKIMKLNKILNPYKIRAKHENMPKTQF